MNKKFTAFLAILLLFVFASCNNKKKKTEEEQKPQQDENTLSAEDEELIKMASAFYKTLPLIAENPKNEVNDAKVELGKMLYFDTRLSMDNTISCNSCHDLNTFGVDNKPLSPGVGDVLGDRNSPSSFYAALHTTQFWDGREPDVEAQAKGPILNPKEMAIEDSMTVVKRIAEVPQYVELFKKAFPEGENDVTFDNIANAIAAFERTLLPEAPFDKFMAGDPTALTDEQKAGLKTYMEAGCTACHTGPALGGVAFFKFGIHKEPYWEFTGSEVEDEGKYAITEAETDKYVFKSMSLRNITKTQPYFHDGSVSDLGEAIRIMSMLQVGKELTDEQVQSIISFFTSLEADLPEETKTAPDLFM
jgi:cytochrome c peroxidase